MNDYHETTRSRSSRSSASPPPHARRRARYIKPVRPARLRKGAAKGGSSKPGFNTCMSRANDPRTMRERESGKFGGQPADFRAQVPTCKHEDGTVQGYHGSIDGGNKHEESS